IRDDKSGRARLLAPRFGDLDCRATADERSDAGSGMTTIVTGLLYFDSRARIFKLLFDFCRFLFVDAFLDRLWCGLDQILGFLEPEAGDRPHLFDNVYLFFSDRG